MLDQFKKYFDLEKRPITSAIFRSILLLVSTPFVIFGGSFIYSMYGKPWGFNAFAIITLLFSIFLVTDGFHKRSYKIVPGALILAGVIFNQAIQLITYGSSDASPFFGFASLAFPLFTIAMAPMIRIHKNVAVDIALKVFLIVLSYGTLLSIVFMD